jgi:hypothetical protein
MATRKEIILYSIIGILVLAIILLLVFWRPCGRGSRSFMKKKEDNGCLWTEVVYLTFLSSMGVSTLTKMDNVIGRLSPKLKDAVLNNDLPQDYKDKFAELKSKNLPVAISAMETLLSKGPPNM